MERRILVFVFFTVVAATIFSCQNKKNQEAEAEPRTGEELAKVYCGTCHLYPEPGLLDKDVWGKRILPAMAAQVGIDYQYNLPTNNDSPVHISVEQFEAIKEFYLGTAPDSLAKQSRPPLGDYTTMFHPESVILSPTSVPFTSYLKIDPGNHLIYAHSGEDSSFAVYDNHLRELKKFHIGGVVVDVNFGQSLSSPGNRSGILTKIGYMNPNDFRTGSAEKFDLTVNGNRLQLGNQPLLDSLPRPVQTISCDFNGDGKKQYLVCGFGHLRGELFLATENPSGHFTKQVLRHLPGAIKAYVQDFDGDGLKDIMVLMAQAQEGIYLLHNNGDGSFLTTPLLQFPPVYGSCYFELDDFNNDGAPDILYACGDNADQSAGVLKAFHGVYIFMNDGKLHFKQQYFFPIHGCYKAMARDFDKDGDLDIAAISFFPDHKSQPQESFVYLEQEKPFEFKPYIIHQYDQGSWILMDADDLDGDGDDDIVLGSLVPPLPGRGDAWIREHPKGSVGILLLRNTTIKGR